jgi:hypothetical protein
VPRVYGSWASQVCTACGAWRTMTHPVMGLDGKTRSWHVSAWHPAAELAKALERNDDR